jgi:hypothetical protein
MKEEGPGDRLWARLTGLIADAEDIFVDASA